MINIPQDSLDELKEVFLFANVPSYLLRRFRSFMSAGGFGESFAVQDLINTINEVEQRETPTLDDIVVGYAALVALTFKSVDEYDPFIKNVAFKKLDWAEKMLRIYDGKRVQSQTLKSDLSASAPISLAWRVNSEPMGQPPFISKASLSSTHK